MESANMVLYWPQKSQPFVVRIAPDKSRVVIDGASIPILGVDVFDLSYIHKFLPISLSEPGTA